VSTGSTPQQHVAAHATRSRDAFAVVSGRLPFEVETERDALTDLAVQRVLGRVERDREGLETDAPVLARCLAHDLRPQRVGADLQRLPARQPDLVVAHHDGSELRPPEIRPVPRDAIVGVQRESYEPAVPVGAPPRELPGLGRGQGIGG
jgi:hypothetical protein